MTCPTLERKFEEQVLAPTDMVGHMRVIRDYARQCALITEFGVYDCTSTWALLAGYPRRMRSYDVIRRLEVDEVEACATAAGIDFQFLLGNTAEVSIEPTNLLFIDSYHTYDHLKVELDRHAKQVKTYILLHDTTTFGDVDQCGLKPGLWQAIEEFTAQAEEWKIKERFSRCHGLTVLERK